MNSTRHSSLTRKTLLIRLRAAVDEELAVSDEVLHGLNNITLNGHFLALVYELSIAKPRIGFCQNASESFSLFLLPPAFARPFGSHILPRQRFSFFSPPSSLQQTHAY